MSQHQNQQPSGNHLPQLNPLNSPSSPSQNHSSSSSSLLPSFSFVASDNDDSGIFYIDDYHAFDTFDVEAQQQLISTLLSSPDNTTANATTATTSFHRHHQHQHHHQHHQVRFVSYPYYLPLSPSFDSSSYITINGNEETCGSSFSDTCSLMASFDTCGVCFPGAFSRFHNHLDTFNSRDTVADAEADVWDWSDFLKEESCF